MARTISEIQAEIIAAKNNDATLSGLTSGSATAIWRLWTYIVAVSIWGLEKLFDLHKSEVQALLDEQKPHTLRWYVAKAKAFQYGYDLVDGEDYYDNTGLDPDTIADSKIIVAAAATESNGTLFLKVAQLVGAGLEPLDNDGHTAFQAYIAEIKDAGVKVQHINFEGDKLKLQIDVYYDATILSSTGARLDGTNPEPIPQTIRGFLQNLPFNGLFVKAHLVDTLQDVDGVFVPEIRSCLAARYDNPAFTSVDIQYQPFAGYLRIYDDTDLTINYIPQSV